MKVIIPVHSFVDLITNSSSETYVQATDKTVDTLKKLIDSLLKGTGQTCDDLFEIDLLPPEDEFSTNAVEVTAKDPKHQKTVEIIRELVSSFQTTEVMC